MAVSIIFISMLQPSLALKGHKKNTAVIFDVCSAPGGSFFHKHFIEMLWSLTTRYQDIPEFHLDFLANTGA